VERSSENKEGTDGARLKYVCQDSVQHKTKLSRKRKEKRQDSEEREVHPNNGGDPAIIGYACGGAVHVKFSTKREAIHVVYKHNSIHGRPVDDDRYVISKKYSVCRRRLATQVVAKLHMY
jgi:hypothetical protein